MVGEHVSEIISLVFMAFALGMDAFSVSLGMGMRLIRLKRIAFIGMVVGVFHIIMPFIGIMLGKAISGQIGHVTIFIGSLLLIVIGLQMFFSAFNHDVKKFIQPTGFGLLLFAISVSLDSFSVGLSLGMSGVKTFVALLLFGGVSMVMTWAGMVLGKKVHGYLGVYSEMLGGSILCVFGLVLLFA